MLGIGGRVSGSENLDEPYPSLFLVPQALGRYLVVYSNLDPGAGHPLAPQAL